ncbi:MAG: hypothetical protein JWM80_5273 [Cyanobacteria bacterium RYN_339]|nr:hypothetical protein [Cyanobacteria bacterium RYN_339]
MMKRFLPLLGLAVLAVACRPQGAAPVEVVLPVSPSPAATTAPTATPAGRALPASQAPALPNGQVVGLVAQATGPDGALAGADVKVFRLGQPAPMAAGKAGTNGAFLVDLGAAFPVDAPVQVVATKDGQTVVAMGTAHVISGNGSAIVAQGGGNVISGNGSAIISTNGGGIISTNGSGIVAQGGGNIVAQGGGNYGLLDAVASPEPGLQAVDAAAALTWALLGPRFRGAGQALTVPGSGDVIRKDLPNLQLAYNVLVEASNRSLQSGIRPAEVHQLLAGFDANGKGKLDPALSRSFATLPGLKEAFQRAAINTEEAISAGVADGGTKPTPDTLERIEFAGASADPINVEAGTAPLGSQGATDSYDGY